MADQPPPPQTFAQAAQFSQPQQPPQAAEAEPPSRFMRFAIGNRRMTASSSPPRGPPKITVHLPHPNMRMTSIGHHRLSPLDQGAQADFDYVVFPRIYNLFRDLYEYLDPGPNYITDIRIHPHKVTYRHRHIVKKSASGIIIESPDGPDKKANLAFMNAVKKKIEDSEACRPDGCLDHPDPTAQGSKTEFVVFIEDKPATYGEANQGSSSGTDGAGSSGRGTGSGARAGEASGSSTGIGLSA
ncbi:hypothetical protein QBC44DRAFT_367868 [Cladorrhinum sp. PSN332]|nr:hypothetical protein QBC44DRAFT_367868 [Cladorrhinum sp. PSN332]